MFYVHLYVYVHSSFLDCRANYVAYFLANDVDPDQPPHYVASDLGLHCLPMTLLRVSQQVRTG